MNRAKLQTTNEAPRLVGASEPDILPQDRFPRTGRSFAIKRLLLSMALALAALVALLSYFLTRSPRAQPALHVPLPTFQLLDQRGEPFGSAELKGKVWVADFVFTSCPSVCPKLTQRMADIAQRTVRFGDAFRLVTFTVDPENDTPARLSAYADRYHADPGRWVFLTGSLGDVETTVVKGFKIAMGKEESTPGSGIMTIFHGEHLVLVDAQGSIRGYYDADEEGTAKLISDAEALLSVR